MEREPSERSEGEETPLAVLSPGERGSRVRLALRLSLAAGHTPPPVGRKPPTCVWAGRDGGGDVQPLRGVLKADDTGLAGRPRRIRRGLQRFGQGLFLALQFLQARGQLDVAPRTSHGERQAAQGVGDGQGLAVPPVEQLGGLQVAKRTGPHLRGGGGEE